MNHQPPPELTEEPVTLKKPILEAEMQAARLFAIDIIAEHQPISYSRAAFMANQSPEINQFAFHDAVRQLGKEGIVSATGMLGYGDLSMARQDG